MLSLIIKVRNTELPSHVLQLPHLTALVSFTKELWYVAHAYARNFVSNRNSKLLDMLRSLGEIESIKEIQKCCSWHTTGVANMKIPPVRLFHLRL